MGCSRLTALSDPTPITRSLTPRNTQTFNPDPIGDLIYQGIASKVFTSDLSNTLAGDLTYRLGALHALRGGFYFGEYGVESDQRSQVFPIVTGQPAITPISVAANLNKSTWSTGYTFRIHCVLLTG